MKKILKRTATVLLVFCLLLCSSVVWQARSTDQLNADIAALEKQSKELESKIANYKSEKNARDKVLAAIQEKVANTQEQIRRYNQEISRINSEINKNNAEISAKNAEIEENKLIFKKRIRAIYMSNTGSSVQVLMGAESFADYLQLAQMISAVSSHDQAIIENIVAAIDELNQKKAENENLLNQQVAAKDEIVAKQKQLEAEEADAQKLVNESAVAQSQYEQQNKNVESQIAAKQAELERALRTDSGQSFVNPKTGFMWPVPGYYNITSGFGSRWGTTHRGIDISSGGIFGKPIVAITDGIVYDTYSACPHRDKASRCSCGSGWGNHVKIDHGTIGGNHYKAIYAHMDSLAVGNGAHVSQGQVIGYVGTTGDSLGYHLHFSLILNNSYVNPYPYFY